LGALQVALARGTHVMSENRVHETGRMEYQDALQVLAPFRFFSWLSGQLASFRDDIHRHRKLVLLAIPTSAAKPSEAALEAMETTLKIHSREQDEINSVAVVAGA